MLRQGHGSKLMDPSTQACSCVALELWLLSVQSITSVTFSGWSMTLLSTIRKGHACHAQHSTPTQHGHESMHCAACAPVYQHASTALPAMPFLMCQHLVSGFSNQRGRSGFACMPGRWVLDICEQQQVARCLSMGAADNAVLHVLNPLQVWVPGSARVMFKCSCTSVLG